MRYRIVVAVLFLVSSAGNAWAQGVQTGTIRGVVKDQQNLAVPGVTATASSDVMQEPRVVVTDELGAYAFPALPAGD